MLRIYKSSRWLVTVMGGIVIITGGGTRTHAVQDL
jgi:hypothetical protein